MDVTQAVPDVINGRAVVAMVGLDTVWMGEEAPMDCDGKCEEWDISNEFETVDGLLIMVVICVIWMSRSKAADGLVMMVGEVTGSGYLHQTLSSCSLLKADMVYGAGGGHSHCGA